MKITIKEEELHSGESAAIQTDFAKSPMSGTVVKLFCKVGQIVKKDEPLISVEAMKMEFLVKATREVKIKEVRANEGKFVQMGDQLIIFEKSQ